VSTRLPTFRKIYTWHVFSTQSSPLSKDGRGAGGTESIISAFGAAVTVGSKGTNGSVDVGRIP